MSHEKIYAKNLSLRKVSDAQSVKNQKIQFWIQDLSGVSREHLSVELYAFTADAPPIVAVV